MAGQKLERLNPAPLYVVLVSFTARPGAEAAFLSRVRRQAADSLELEPGCRRFDVCTDPGDPARVVLYEIYDDAAAFALHVQSAHYRGFAAEVAPLVAAKAVQLLETAEP